MKIAVFHNLPKGGALRVTEEQIKRLKRHHQVDVYGLRALKGAITSGGNKVIAKLISRPRNDFFKFHTLKKLHQQLAQKIDQKNYDVVLVHPSRYTQAPYLLRFLKTPSVYYAHEVLRICYEPHLKFQEKVNFPKKIYEKTYRFFLKRADFLNAKSATKIIVNSKQTQKWVFKAYGAEAQVCYPGIDINHFRPLSEVKKEDILFVGKPCKVNGFDLLKKSFSLIKPSPQINIVNGKLTEKQLIEAYNRASLTVCASISEPLGLVPLESQACQTPVIAVKEGGYQETISDGLGGFLVERNPMILAQKIKLLLQNPALVKKMGRQGRKHVKKEWNWSKSIKKLETILKRTK